MKGSIWRFWPLVLMGLSHAAAAPNCDTLRLNHFEAIRYIDKAEFPNPSKEVLIGIQEMKKPVAVCGLAVENTTNLITIKAKKRDILAFSTNTTGDTSPISLSSYSIRQDGLVVEGIKINITMLDTDKNYSAKASIPGLMIDNSAVGMRIDGGKLLPMYWPDGDWNRIAIPKKTRTLEFYLKSELDTNWQRVSVDLKSPTIKVYRKFPFPAK
ncbi:hypothetical protein [Deinococcus sp. AJ005]|uniref:hypothetical protein n=1 Tax=Deinococcus sp. AJ005 TaxID=2652443 RepID=UPI00125CC6F4|nr:hypothetical protein [Deinococcus sp. AJ005]QFP78542.1 hypothetical protein DAAJ005_18390 [Deinococcus sp. AJ005]